MGKLAEMDSVSIIYPNYFPGNVFVKEMDTKPFIWGHIFISISCLMALVKHVKQIRNVLSKNDIQI